MRRALHRSAPVGAAGNESELYLSRVAPKQGLLFSPATQLAHQKCCEKRTPIQTHNLFVHAFVPKNNAQKSFGICSIFVQIRCAETPIGAVLNEIKGGSSDLLWELKTNNRYGNMNTLVTESCVCSSTLLLIKTVHFAQVNGIFT